MHGGNRYCEEESFKTRDRSVCVTVDLHGGGGIFSAVHLALLARTQKTSVSVRVHVCFKCNVHVSQRKGGSGAGATAGSFPRMSNRSVHPPESHVQLPAPKKAGPWRPRGGPEGGEIPGSGDRGLDGKTHSFTWCYFQIFVGLFWVIVVLGSRPRESH